MTAIGFLLFVIGVVGATMYPPQRYSWGVRDLFGVLPFSVGALLLVAGLVTFLWRVAP